MKTIFVSIASYLDSELEQTVRDLLQKAKEPDKIHLSVNSQNRPDQHPDLELICFQYGATITYFKMDFRESKGTCSARSICQRPLNNDFKYYMQIDSHSLFLPNWDTNLVKDYENARSKWGDYIFSTYPLAYYYGDDTVPQFETKKDNISNCLEIINNRHFSLYTGLYTDFKGDEFGYRTDYFAGGFSFGDASHFLKVPYDSRIYHTGEEPTMSIRFFCEGIAIVCPKTNYIYHHFFGSHCGRRSNHWDEVDDWDRNNQKDLLDQAYRLSEDVVNKFYKNELEYPYGAKDVEKMQEWISKVLDKYEGD